MHTNHYEALVINLDYQVALVLGTSLFAGVVSNHTDLINYFSSVYSDFFKQLKWFTFQKLICLNMFVKPLTVQMVF